MVESRKGSATEQEKSSPVQVGFLRLGRANGSAPPMRAGLARPRSGPTGAGPAGTPSRAAGPGIVKKLDTAIPQPKKQTRPPPCPARPVAPPLREPAPRPRDTPPQPRDTPPQPRDTPPRPRDTPPQPRDTPPPARDTPPQLRDTPPPARDTPPQPRDTPPQLRDTPPRPQDTSVPVPNRASFAVRRPGRVTSGATRATHPTTAAVFTPKKSAPGHKDRRRRQKKG